MGGNQTQDDLSGGEILPRTSAIIDLPPPDTKRWVARCNAVIVNAVRSGAISPDQEGRLYHLDRRYSSLLTRRWREADSNRRSLSQNEPVSLAERERRRGERAISKARSILGETEGSNPLPSTGESGKNCTATQRLRAEGRMRFMAPGWAAIPGRPPA
jgi:uncharacterized protein DUF1153